MNLETTAAPNSPIENQFKNRFRISSDFRWQNLLIGERSFRGYFLETLVNLPATMVAVRQAEAGGNLPTLLTSVPQNPTIDYFSDMLLQGMLVLFGDDGNAVVLEPERHDISREVSVPQTENPLQSAFDAFTEDLSQNVGMLRKKIVSDKLVIENRIIGVKSIKKIAIIDMDGSAQANVIQSIRSKLDLNRNKELTTVRDLLQILGHPRFTIMPTYISSELPGEMAQNLLNGKVVIMVDQLSFAFAFPAVVTDLWSTTLDMQYPYLFQVFLRTIRSIAAFLAITLPGLYIVLNSVNPELLRIQLAITVAKSREGVPYPSLIEMLLVMLLLEMIIEATIRLPKNIGPTITMIGGILLGQAIVQAKLVSNLSIIILVASAIANFTLAGYMNTVGIRMYKYVVMLVSTIFGIWGLVASIMWILFHFASLNNSNIPYLSAGVKGNMPDE